MHLAAQPGAGDGPEVSRADLVHRRIQWRRVGEIVVLPPQLDLLVLGDREILEHGEIHAEQTGGHKNVAAAISVMPPSGYERRGVEPPRDAPPAAVQPAVGDAVGPASAARATVVHRR